MNEEVPGVFIRTWMDIRRATMLRVVYGDGYGADLQGLMLKGWTVVCAGHSPRDYGEWR